MSRCIRNGVSYKRHKWNEDNVCVRCATWGLAKVMAFVRAAEEAQPPNSNQGEKPVEHNEQTEQPIRRATILGQPETTEQAAPIAEPTQNDETTLNTEPTIEEVRAIETEAPAAELNTSEAPAEVVEETLNTIAADEAAVADAESEGLPSDGATA